MREADVKRVHEGRSFTERRTVRLMSDEQRTDGDGNVRVEVELGIDRERHRLRDALQAAGEHDRRAELACATRPGERRARPEAAAREAAGATRQNVRLGLAPSVREASISVGSMASKEAIAWRR